MGSDVLLADAVADAGITVDDIVGDLTGVDVADVVHDSRAVTRGAVFACVRGSVADGHDYASAATSEGAVALLVERPLAESVPQLVVSDVRATMGHLAAAVWGRPATRLTMVGVTGTAGKTTVTHMIAATLEAAGRSTLVQGTLSGALTTPEATDLHRTLAQQPADVEAVAMEVSSHALTLDRVDGVVFDAAVFTNLGVDHLDFHTDMDDYFAAKRRLFDSSRCSVGFVCAEDEWGSRLLADRDPGLCPRHPYSLGDVEDLELGPHGSTFTWRGHQMAVHLPGRFNVLNAVAACTVASHLGVDVTTIAAGLRSVERVRGRFEAVLVDGADVDVVVDYSHKPDALAAALRAAREFATGRLIVVFGAGGDRDRSKRPLMGSVASELADVVVVTSDNPRSEPPMQIIDEIVAGTHEASGPANVIVIEDRAEAIQTAVDTAQSGDLVVVAGKGHETTQTIGDEKHAFDDVEVARTALAARVDAHGDGPHGGTPRGADA